MRQFNYVTIVTGLHVFSLTLEITLLHVYVCRYDPSRLLMTFGASANKADKVHGNTPLHWACFTGNTCVIAMLLKTTASIDALNAKVSRTFLSIVY